MLLGDASTLRAADGFSVPFVSPRGFLRTFPPNLTPVPTPALVGLPTWGVNAEPCLTMTPAGF